MWCYQYHYNDFIFVFYSIACPNKIDSCTKFLNDLDGSQNSQKSWTKPDTGESHHQTLFTTAATDTVDTNNTTDNRFMNFTFIHG